MQNSIMVVIILAKCQTKPWQQNVEWSLRKDVESTMLCSTLQHNTCSLQLTVQNKGETIGLVHQDTELHFVNLKMVLVDSQTCTTHLATGDTCRVLLVVFL